MRCKVLLLSSYLSEACQTKLKITQTGSPLISYSDHYSNTIIIETDEYWINWMYMVSRFALVEVQDLTCDSMLNWQQTTWDIFWTNKHFCQLQYIFHILVPYRWTMNVLILHTAFVMYKLSYWSSYSIISILEVVLSYQKTGFITDFLKHNQLKKLNK
jgi:hypothetical protein